MVQRRDIMNLSMNCYRVVDKHISNMKREYKDRYENDSVEVMVYPVLKRNVVCLVDELNRLYPNMKTTFTKCYINADSDILIDVECTKEDGTRFIILRVGLRNSSSISIANLICTRY